MATPQATLENAFVCDCEVSLRSACDGEPFYEEYDGKRYCVLHFPGTTKKLSFGDALKRKIDAKDFNFRGVWFPDKVTFSGLTFSSDADFSHSTFYAESDFSNVVFAALVTFSAATFRERAYFPYSQFGEVNFEGAKFTREALFVHAEFMTASFSRAEFLGLADFGYATFRTAYFQHTTFFGNSVFGHNTFHERANFQSAIFFAEADFENATLGSAEFRGVSFRNGALAGFSKTIFIGFAGFSYANFEGLAYFDHADFKAGSDFGNAEFKTHAHFKGSNFGSEKDTTLGAGADFSNAKFIDNADFAKAMFNTPAYFSNAKFEREAEFRDASFASRAYFTKTEFKALAGFSYTVFASLAGFNYATFNTRAFFIKSTFQAEVNFSHAVFRDYLRFTEDRFENGSLVDLQFAQIERPDRIFFHTLTLCPHWFVNVDARKFDFTTVNWGDGKVSTEVAGLRRKEHSSPHSLLEKTCQQLAINYEKNQGYEQASNFRYWAMNARRLENSRGLAFWRLTWWYWLLSGYGEKIWRAFAALAMIWLTFAFLYTSVGFARWEPKLESERDVASASFDDIGEPLPLRQSVMYSLGVMSLQKPVPRAATNTARALVTLETILGPVQAALLALAIRRKFMR